MPADTSLRSRLLRAALALSGLASLIAGLLLLPAAPGSLAAASSGGAHGGGGSALTVHGPRMWDPATMKTTGPDAGYGSDYADRSTVTVSQTKNLVYQAVQVSWTGFTPTNFNGSAGFDSSQTFYPVMIAECKGADPTNPDQCYGGTSGGTPSLYGPYGPENTVFATTTRNGTGEAVLEVQTVSQNTSLGCSSSQPCSVLIVPAQGGNLQVADPGGSPKFVCQNHLYDSSLQLASANSDFGGLSTSDAPCSWANRIVVPLHFSPTTSTCPADSGHLTIVGSPMLGTAMNRWDTALCEGSQPLAITDLADVAESEAITQVVLEGTGDVALTTLPSTVGTTSGQRTYTYAPVAVSATAIGYWADNPNNGTSQTGMRLNPRLMAKLVTLSYDLLQVTCQTGGDPGVTCDKKISENNPLDIFEDHEFMRLNPRISEPQAANGFADTPIVMAGDSDMTYELTRWIAANPAAEAFLRGKPDPWGMTVNGYYKNIIYPASDFASSDPTTVMSVAFSPVATLSAVANDLVEATPPGDSYDAGCPVVNKSCPTGPYARFGTEPLGYRALFSVLDTGDTAGFDVPVAAIPNHAGRYVQPTNASMAAALSSMVTAKNGITQQVNLSSNNPAAYPLTMVIYAMVPTHGVSQATADLVARWLRYVVGPGQVPGDEPGQLPPGYLPLPSNLRAEALAAANAVQHQTGNPDTSTPTPTASATLSPSPAGKVASPSPSPTISLPDVSPRLTTAAVRDPLGAGITRYALPALLILGSLAALGGAASLTVGSPGAAAALTRLRRIYKTGIKRWRRP
jgi:hypothetical protein